jgi:hypothetical protein
VSIYTNLFRYRPRPTRTPQEDFLTAALADILNRVPRDTSVKFVADILLAGHEKRQLWLDFANAIPVAQLRWVTQIGVRHRQGGIVDLLLLVDGQEAIVIENKIGAMVRAHKDELAEPTDVEADPKPLPSLPVADANQLRTYGNWLAALCKDRPWPGALILLTHYSAAPADFDGPTPGNYGVPLLQVCRWGMIWRWAKVVGAQALANDVFNDDPKTRPDWKGLCHEFAEFLEEENMTSDYMTFHDLAAIEVFVSSANRIERTFQVVREALKPAKNEFGKGNFYALAYDGDLGIVWGSWFYVKKRTPPTDWHFSWGIRFPSVSKYWLGCNPPLPQVAHAFLSLDTDGSDLPLSSLKPTDIPDGWVMPPKEENLIIAKPLYQFRPDAEGLAADFGEWVATSLKSARPMLDKLIKASG